MLEKLFSPKGRVTRLQNLGYELLVSVSMWVVGAVLLFAVFGAMYLVGVYNESLAPGSGLSIIFLPLTLVAMYSNIIIKIKRLHDMNLSGWWLPIFLLLAIPYIALYFWPGTKGKNRFDEDNYKTINNSNPSLAKAVVNHTNDTTCNIKYSGHNCKDNNQKELDIIARINALFPLWAILFSLAAYFQPHIFTPMKSNITPLLVAIMFFMGVTLRLEDFSRVLKKPKPIMLTVILQFTIMPLAALLLSKALGFSTELLIGMVLVGAVSGGTASNVITYLAKGDVALSITMTITSTLLSIIATPFLTLIYVGQSVPVPASAMFLSILQLVLAPVLIGVIVNYFLHRFIKRYEPYLATFSMLAIVLIIAIVVALNQGRIATIGLMSVAGIILHNLTGLSSGYWMARLMGYEHKICKTIAIEVGMQNSGLAVALAMKYFTPLSALPGAIFSVWHNISGALLAGYWSRKK